MKVILLKSKAVQNYKKGEAVTVGYTFGKFLIAQGLAYDAAGPKPETKKKKVVKESDTDSIKEE